MTESTSKRSTARNLQILNCRVQGSTIHSAIIEDVLIDGLKTSGLFQMWGAVFKHVELRGQIGRIMISRAISLGTASAQVQSQFDAAHREYYKKIDWALDISQGIFQECELQGIPVALIRRDPETQVIVRRKTLLTRNWQDLDLSATHWATSLDFLVSREDEDAVLVAGRGNKNFLNLKEGLDLLVNAGIAER